MPIRIHLVAAGVFVAASAGNSGPTTAHNPSDTSGLPIPGLPAHLRPAGFC